MSEPAFTDEQVRQFEQRQLADANWRRLAALTERHNAEVAEGARHLNRACASIVRSLAGGMRDLDARLRAQREASDRAYRQWQVDQLRRRIEERS